MKFAEIDQEQKKPFDYKIEKVLEAFVAILAYAAATNNKILAADLLRWVEMERRIGGSDETD